jgi:hypothetical protein
MDEFLKELDSLLDCQREYLELAEAFQKQADEMRAHARRMQLKINGVRNRIRDRLEK